MIVSADELLVGLELTLRDHLPTTVAALVTQHDWDADDFPTILDWQQLPTLEALSTADTPSIALTSPGLVGEPKYSRADGGYHGTWALSVGVYDRGEDHAHVQAKIRRWCAAIRLTARAHRTLGGVATGLTWGGDRYGLKPNRDQARTLGMGAVVLNVSALVIDLLAPGQPVSTTPTPTVSVQ